MKYPKFPSPLCSPARLWLLLCLNATLIPNNRLQHKPCVVNHSIKYILNSIIYRAQLAEDAFPLVAASYVVWLVFFLGNKNQTMI